MQPNAATPHQINGLCVMATNVEHAASDVMIEEPVDLKASTTDLMSFWRPLANGAAALTVILALVSEAPCEI